MRDLFQERCRNRIQITYSVRRLRDEFRNLISGNTSEDEKLDIVLPKYIFPDLALTLSLLNMLAIYGVFAVDCFNSALCCHINDISRYINFFLSRICGCTY